MAREVTLSSGSLGGRGYILSSTAMGFCFGVVIWNFLVGLFVTLMRVGHLSYDV